MALRQIEEAVTGRKPGELPTDAPDPDLRTHRVVLELGGSAYTLWRQANLALDELHERHLDDDARATAMAIPVLERCDANSATNRDATNRDATDIDAMDTGWRTSNPLVTTERALARTAGLGTRSR